MLLNVFLLNLVLVLCFIGLGVAAWNLFVYIRHRLAVRKAFAQLAEIQRKQRAFYNQRHNKPWINRHGRLHKTLT